MPGKTYRHRRKLVHREPSASHMFQFTASVDSSADDGIGLAGVFRIYGQSFHGRKQKRTTNPVARIPTGD